MQASRSKRAEPLITQQKESGHTVHWRSHKSTHGSSHTSLNEGASVSAHNSSVAIAVNGQPDADTKSVRAGREVERKLAKVSSSAEGANRGAQLPARRNHTITQRSTVRSHSVTPRETELKFASELEHHTEPRDGGRWERIGLAWTRRDAFRVYAPSWQCERILETDRSWRRVPSYFGNFNAYTSRLGRRSCH